VAALDIKKLTSARKVLKRDWLIWVISFLGGYPLIFTACFIGNNQLANGAFGIIVFLWSLLFFVEWIVTIFRIRFVYQTMGKRLLTITLFQLGTVFTPFGLGMFIFPPIVLAKSKNSY